MPANLQTELPAQAHPLIGRAVLPRRPDIVFLLLTFLLTIVCPHSIHAQTNAAAAPAPTNTMLVSSNRVLFIINTSSGMKKHIADLQTIVGKIINSNGDGQFYRGDTLGVWTFNKAAYSDFPLQVWDPKNRPAIAANLDNFIRGQKYQEHSHFEKVLGDLFNVMRVSDFLTVIILSNGDDKFKGILLDKEINAQIEQTYHDAKDHGIPLAIIIQSRLGKILRHSVTPFPWPIVVPQTPLPKIVTIAPPVVAAPKPAPVTPPVVPNLIIIGKPQPPPVIVTNPAPTPVVAAPPVAPAPAPVATVPAPTQVTPEATIVTPAPAPTSITAAPTNEPIAETKPPASAAQPLPVEAITPPAASAITPSNNAPTTNALAIIPPNGNHSQLLLFGGIILFLIAAGLIFVMVQRSRTASSPSFITRSMTNKRK